MRGRSICVMSPVMTIRESPPRRVRNIFICSRVVFWASSRMTNESFSVRPRMNASGATSITPLSISRGPVDVHHVVQRVVQRPQVRVDLLGEVARQKAELLAGLDRWSCEHHAVDRAAPAPHRPLPWRGTSCRCRPARCRR